MKCSLIISTYNQPEFLSLAIQSAIEQTRLPDEIVIADDGSGEETRQLIEDWKKRCSQLNPPVPLIHTWLPDEGFRVMLARNNAVAASSGDYLIFLDGDCFLNEFFIEDHLSFAEPGHVVAGTRVNLRRKRKEYILRTGDRRISFFSWGTGKKFHAIRSRFLSMLHKNGGMASANFSIWRSDFELVNGFNERLAGYSGCDNELRRRLEDNEISIKRMVHWGIAYHFDHPAVKRVRWRDGNKVREKIREIRNEDKIRCKDGLNRALERMKRPGQEKGIELAVSKTFGG